MIQTWKAWVALGALNGFCAVAAGAYAKHGLNAPEPVLADAFNTGVDYQMWHALALLAVAWLAERAESGGRAGESPRASKDAPLSGRAVPPVGGPIKKSPRAYDNAPLSGREPWLARLSGLAFVLGIVLFSGTLYAFGASGEVWMNGAAPAGGILLMTGWALLALSPIGGRGRSG